eukprot:tig00000489_g1378.t1
MESFIQGAPPGGGAGAGARAGVRARGADYVDRREHIPLTVVKRIMRQLLEATAFIHSRGIPANILIDPTTERACLADFGCAKGAEDPAGVNVPYIGSRFYRPGPPRRPAWPRRRGGRRAPELMFGAKEYGPAVDMWSLGCVFAELILRHPLFPGRDAADQLFKMTAVLGFPRREDVPWLDLPAVAPISLAEVFRPYNPQGGPAEPFPSVPHGPAAPPSPRAATPGRQPAGAADAGVGPRAAHHGGPGPRPPLLRRPPRAPARPGLRPLPPPAPPAPAPR